MAPSPSWWHAPVDHDVIAAAPTWDDDELDSQSAEIRLPMGRPATIRAALRRWAGFPDGSAGHSPSSRWVVPASGLAVLALIGGVMIMRSGEPAALDGYGHVRTYSDAPKIAWTYDASDSTEPSDPAASFMTFVTGTVDGGSERVVLIVTRALSDTAVVEIDGIDRASGERAWQVTPQVDGEDASRVDCAPWLIGSRVVCLLSAADFGGGPAELVAYDTATGDALATADIEGGTGPWMLAPGGDQDLYVIGNANDSTDQVVLMRYARGDLTRSWTQTVHVTVPAADGGGLPSTSYYVTEVASGVLLEYTGTTWGTRLVSSGDQLSMRDQATAPELGTIDIRSDGTVVEYSYDQAGVTAFDLGAHELWTAPDLRYLASNGLTQGGPVLGLDLDSGEMVALNPKSGDELWRQDRSLADHVAVNSAGLLAIEGSDGALERLDPTNGDTVWSTDLDTFDYMQTFLSNEHVYIGTSRGLIGIDRASGKLAWSFDYPNAQRGGSSLFTVGKDLGILDGGTFALLK